MAVSDWSTTPGSNGTVGGIDISEGCHAKGLNNAVRAVMAEAKAEFDLKAPLASPALTGTPTAPTAAAGTDTTQIATTAYAKGEADRVDGTAVHKTGDETVAGTKTFSSTISGDVSGNAGTATKLATARAMHVEDADGTNSGASVNFDGSANIALALPATIKADIAGNASTASALESAFTLTLAGDVSGSATIDGSGNVTMQTSASAPDAGTMLIEVFDWVFDSSGRIDYTFSGLGVPMDGDTVFYPSLGIISGRLYLAQLADVTQTGFTVQVYYPDGTPGCNVEEIVTAGTIVSGEASAGQHADDSVVRLRMQFLVPLSVAA